MTSAQRLSPVDPALAEIANTRPLLEAAVSSDGLLVAYVEAAGVAGKSAIYLTSSVPSTMRSRITAGDGKSFHDEHGVSWSPGGKTLAFLSDHQKKGQLQLYVAAPGSAARQLTHLKGLLADLKWSPDGKRIAILFTENLPRAAGPLDPVLPQTGVLESHIYEQRLAIVDAATGAVRQVSPADTYIYEYDWSPHGDAFAATAAKGEAITIGGSRSCTRSRRKTAG